MAKPTKRQRERERFSRFIDELIGKETEAGKQMRARNRLVEKRKRKQFNH